MPRQKVISKNTVRTRLFRKDERFLKGIVRDNKENNKTEFQTEASALRYFVEIGIATHKRTDAATSLEHKIIRRSQKGIMMDVMKPTHSLIKTLIDYNKELLRTVLTLKSFIVFHIVGVEANLFNKNPQKYKNNLSVIESNLLNLEDKDLDKIVANQNNEIKEISDDIADRILDYFKKLKKKKNNSQK